MALSQNSKEKTTGKDMIFAYTMWSRYKKIIFSVYKNVTDQDSFMKHLVQWIFIQSHLTS